MVGIFFEYLNRISFVCLSLNRTTENKTQRILKLLRHQGVYYPPSRNDNEACVSIGIHAGPSDTKEISGGVIGGDCLMNTQDAGKNVVIGGGRMRSSTSTTSHNNVLLGDSCCESQSGDNFSRSVCIGYQSCIDTMTATNITNNVAIGANSLRGTVQSNIVAIGAEAANTAGGGTVHSGAICIGASTGLVFGTDSIGPIVSVSVQHRVLECQQTVYS